MYKGLSEKFSKVQCVIIYKWAIWLKYRNNVQYSMRFLLEIELGGLPALHLLACGKIFQCGSCNKIHLFFSIFVIT